MVENRSAQHRMVSACITIVYSNRVMSAQAGRGLESGRCRRLHPLWCAWLRRSELQPGEFYFPQGLPFSYRELQANYQSVLSTFWGSWAFMIGSVIQLWETLWREDPEPQGDKTSSVNEEKETPKTVES